MWTVLKACEIIRTHEKHININVPYSVVNVNKWFPFNSQEIHNTKKLNGINWIGNIYIMEM